jgi:hypothetical protein
MLFVRQVAGNELGVQAFNFRVQNATFEAHATTREVDGFLASDAFFFADHDVLSSECRWLNVRPVQASRHPEQVFCRRPDLPQYHCTHGRHPLAAESQFVVQNLIDSWCVIQSKVVLQIINCSKTRLAVANIGLARFRLRTLVIDILHKWLPTLAQNFQGNFVVYAVAVDAQIYHGWRPVFACGG